jgi:hypothetical protein
VRLGRQYTWPHCTGQFLRNLVNAHSGEPLVKE